jgi:hypothetical protein
MRRAPRGAPFDVTGFLDHLPVCMEQTVEVCQETATSVHDVVLHE